MVLKLDPGEVETDRKAYEKNCLGFNCERFQGARNAVDATRIIIKCAIYDGISAVVQGCPGESKEQE